MSQSLALAFIKKSTATFIFWGLIGACLAICYSELIQRINFEEVVSEEVREVPEPLSPNQVISVALSLGLTALVTQILLEGVHQVFGPKHCTVIMARNIGVTEEREDYYEPAPALPMPPPQYPRTLPQSQAPPQVQVQPQYT